MYDSIEIIDRKVKIAFDRAKSDILMLQKNAKAQTQAINMLIDNQKKMMMKIRELEMKVREEKDTLVVQAVTQKKKESFIGAKSTMRLHHPNCPFSKNINAENMVVFNSKTKAFGKGYSACDCLKK